MQFLRPISLLWGVAAAAFVVWLHLRRRAIAHERPWAAMRLLRAALADTQRRRAKIERLLMVLRAACVLAVAIAASEPRWDAPVGGDRAGRRFVVAIDATPSMRTRRQGRTRFEAAQARALEVVAQADPNDRYLLATPELAAADSSQHWLAPNVAAGAIGRLKPTDDAAWLIDALAAAGKIFATDDEHEKAAPPVWFVASDLQRSTWTDRPGGGSRANVADLVEDVASDADVTVVDVGNAPDRQAAVGAVSIVGLVPVVGRPTVLRGEIARLAEAPSDVGFTWRINGDVIEVGAAELAAAAVTVELGYRFDSPGEYVVELEIDADEYPSDDVSRLIVTVREQVSIVCVAKDRADGRPASDYVVAALESTDDQASPRRRIEVVPPTGLNAARARDADVVVLCNVEAPSPELIEKFVGEGGLVLSFSGELTAGERPATDLSGGSGMRMTDAGRKIWGGISSFADAFSEPLTFRAVAPSQPTGGEVLLEFSHGPPAVVRRALRRGAECNFAFPASLAPRLPDDAATPWTLLPASPVFVPLLDRLVEQTLLDLDRSKTLIVGDPLPIGKARFVVRPDGLRAPVAGATPSTAPETPAALAGVYRTTDDPAATDHLFAVNVDRNESDPTRLEASDLPSRVRVVSGDAAIRPEFSREASGFASIAGWLLVAAAAAFLAQTLIAANGAIRPRLDPADAPRPERFGRGSSK